MLAAYTRRKLPSASRRCSWTRSDCPAGQRSVPSGCRGKSAPVKRPVFQEVALVGGPYPVAGGDEAGRVAVGSLCGERAGAKTVVRIGVGESRCPNSRRRFHTHCAITCQHSCPQAEWLHQRSGSCSASSSESVGSKAPRCKYSSTTSQAVNACCGRVVKKSS